MEELLKELKEMSALKDDASLEKAREIRAKYNSSKEREFIIKYMNGELDCIENEIKIVDAKLERMLSIKAQVKEISEIVSLKYIAKNYFGKSASWLSQRINGSPVRGKIYCLKESELDILNSAIQDIGKKLGSLSIG
ncbi:MULTISPECIES: DUF5053 domain-containing protein [unclassified Bacteroides]|uniref:DUF5053 domain-containing protein n=1 Tax=unclassified Bacteroides TaxID=2646097 RepID=UPI00168A73AF|nr:MULTISPECIES: DUF5053 domain-containing protein [unclassified Bacteroides]MBD3591443.1 DUF5053 domain-containing protein [Bacteroides sp. GM023]